jgi:hypothetical protein
MVSKCLGAIFQLYSRINAQRYAVRKWHSVHRPFVGKRRLRSHNPWRRQPSLNWPYGVSIGADRKRCEQMTQNVASSASLSALQLLELRLDEGEQLR